MKSFVLIGVICLQLDWSYAKGYSNGVGAFSYQDSSGNRYGGTYGLKDGEVVDTKGSFPPDFSPPTDFLPPNFEDPSNFLGFFPEYFRNFENLLQDPGFRYHVQVPQTFHIQTPPYSYSGGPAYNEPKYGNYNSLPNYSFYGPNVNHIPNNDFFIHYINRAFQTNIDGQRLALDAAHKAFDLTSNQAGISHNLNPSRLSPFNDRDAAGFPNMAGPQFPSGFPFSGEFQMPEFNNYDNSAYAGASVGPGYRHQVAAINPGNPNSPNVFKSDQESGNPGGFNSVSVSSSSSSSNVNGRETRKQSADTVINSNGKVSKYHVESP